MAIFLNSSHNVNYTIMFIFFKIMILFNIILDSFLKYLHFFIIKDTAPYYFIKSLKLFRNLAGLKIMIYYY